MAFDSGGVVFVKMEFLGIRSVKIGHEDFESFVLHRRNSRRVECWQWNRKGGAQTFGDWRCEVEIPMIPNETSYNVGVAVVFISERL
jgi:hypothetical protein